MIKDNFVSSGVLKYANRKVINLWTFTNHYFQKRLKN